MLEFYLNKILLGIERGTEKLIKFINANQFSDSIVRINLFFREYDYNSTITGLILSFFIFYYIISNSKKITSLSTYTQFIVGCSKNLFFVKKQINKENVGFIKETAESFGVNKVEFKYSLQENGISLDKLINMVNEISKCDQISEEFISKRSGCNYITVSARNEVNEIAGVCNELFANQDLAYPETVPSCKKLEKNFIDLMIELFHGPAGSDGIITNGGSDSIMGSLWSAKNLAYKRAIKKPEIILSKSAHPAFLKACIVLDLKPNLISLNSDYTINISEVKKTINCNTILIIGNAINFPHGVEDDINSLSDIALKNDLLLHVDGCMGGFNTCFFDFFESTRRNVTDFRVPGVTSISVDSHKYGMTPKGSSILLFRTKQLKELINFSSQGSDGFNSNCCFYDTRNPSAYISALMILAKNGKKTYIEQSKRIHNCVEMLKKTFKERFPKLQVLGNPCISIFSFKGTYASAIQLELKKRKWSINLLQDPVAVMFCITNANIKAFETEFVKDMTECYDYVTKNNIKKSDKMAVVYGLSSFVPEELINQSLNAAVDCFLDSKEFLKYEADRLSKK